MNNPTLLIYDNNGIVWHIRPQMLTVPEGIQGIIVDAPRSFMSVSVNPVTKEAIWVFAPDTEGEVSNLQDVSIDHEDRISVLEAFMNGGNN